ncbi:antirestriction protein [Paraburkholderia sp. USG1]|uniref:antirestriction protein n=1 Tax=Paraburkholderia sp. USG1 TaxID=2952268 RepID=UPI0028547C76|nr:antirestriction protein [Paraburkholderia sp. USG1]MDR8402140.1 antirestriction protein [Paraburkholderia sp. USG1]
MNHNTDTQRISATPVDESARMDMLPRYFGQHMIRAEITVYTAMESLCESYCGGFWDYFELSNDAFYMAPRLDGPLSISCDGNGWSGEMSADAAGIVACLFALNAMAWSTENPRFAQLYDRLLAFADQHAEAGAIYAAID